VQRREFITLFGGGAVTWPLAARAQPTQKMPKVGVLWHAGSAEEEAIYLSELQQGLNGLGYVDGKTIALENRFPNEQPERFVSLAAELAALKVDVLVAVTQQAARAAQRATTTIPIVFIAVPDPVGAKLVNSLARPGGNITGSQRRHARGVFRSWCTVAKRWKRARSCPMEQINAKSSVGPQLMSTKFSRARSPLIYRLNNRPNLSS
jgi:ABC transporter substrate binding protein